MYTGYFGQLIVNVILEPQSIVNYEALLQQYGSNDLYGPL